MHTQHVYDYGDRQLKNECVRKGWATPRSAQSFSLILCTGFILGSTHGNSVVLQTELELAVCKASKGLNYLSGLP